MPAPYTTDKRKYQRQSTQMSDDTLPMAFSGWIHVSVTAKLNDKKKFKRRYCKLRDVVCTFYDSVGQKSKDEDKHVIVSIARLLEVNQGILLIDHNDRHINLYTEVAADFQMWYAAFEEALASARQSKEVRSRSIKNLPTERNSSPQETLAKLKLKSSSDSNLLASEKVRSLWMQKESTSLFSKKMKRRYFVLNGNHLSYFDVNVEGREAEGSGYVSSVKIWESKPNGLEIVLDKKVQIRVATKNTEEAQDWYHALSSASKQEEATLE